MIAVNTELCMGCGVCARVCPAGAIDLLDGVAHIIAEKCTGCQQCVEVCPASALKFTEPVVSLSAPPAQQITVLPAAPDLRPETALVNWKSAALNVVLHRVVPRLADIAVNYLENRLVAPVSEKAPPQAAAMNPTNRKRRRMRRKRNGFDPRS